MMHSCDQLCFQSSVYRSGGTWVIRNEMYFSSWLALFLRNWFVLSGYILYTYYIYYILSIVVILICPGALILKCQTSWKTSKQKRRRRQGAPASNTDGHDLPRRVLTDVSKRTAITPIHGRKDVNVLNKMCLEEIKLTVLSASQAS